MGLEAATFVSDLVASNPTGTDSIAQGDNHLRLLKQVLQNTLVGQDRALVTGKTKSLGLPVGTTAERDTVPVKGFIRYNDDLDQFEGYKEGSAWGNLGGGQMYGNAQRKAIHFNSQTIGENLTVLAGDNGGSFGPITINNGFTVTVENGAVWSIV